jgi:hypothetical protein
MMLFDSSFPLFRTPYDYYCFIYIFHIHNISKNSSDVSSQKLFLFF